jgi:xylulokinase
MNRLTDKLMSDVGLWSSPFVLDGVYSLTAGMATAGSLTGWLKDNFAKDLVQREEATGLNAYDALFNEAEGIPPGAEGLIVLPYFMGERMPILDPKAKGVFFGLTLRHTRGHIVKAALEGIGFGLDQVLDCLRKADIPLRRITSVGGGTKAPLWIQTTSDICGVEQMVPEITVGASYGDALLAGVGIGVLDAKAIKKIIKRRYIAQPDGEKTKAYEPFKIHFRELYRRNKDIMHLLW